MGVSFDLFDTLVTADYPADPAAAVATELAERGVSVPDDWADAYTEVHIDAPDGAEVPLPAHVSRALASRDVAVKGNAARRAVVAAFDPTVETRPGARAAIDAARDRGHEVALCSNCSVPELVGRALVRSSLSRDDFDGIVTSVGCGWRKPAPEIFEQTAAELGVSATDLVHVGDDPRTDGGLASVGGTALLLADDRMTDGSSVSAEGPSGEPGDTHVLESLAELPDALDALPDTLDKTESGGDRLR
ncbi:HAD superfamily hydrolase [Natrialba magadii ATCC 43099]|uniref:HAD superfamily hydrolase n=1 Tax=Natrialba magadii (strain ATCC 43099 / DSM 3394 / CCM 3739 / CIP 104546 / IAM 13178 / JCM 8861 / NBRC 102185 / NCIMB 2190 / MS3) TaxID=547559 RepID=D3SQT2_NATMM|nr:HAD family hydrolase [Natrialba magadii]ADD04570.1 HAD superfamily hydrolase [Natrialba magadii ATCC 43099]ELY25227.1 haloacid dehalogenase [Natrialba magadii ATCC 43099]